MGEPKNPHFYDFGIFGRFQTPQNQLRIFIFGDTRIPKKTRNNLECFLKNIVFVNLNIWETNMLSCLLYTSDAAAILRV